jgi:hypothetical protein
VLAHVSLLGLVETVVITLLTPIQVSALPHHLRPHAHECNLTLLLQFARVGVHCYPWTPNALALIFAAERSAH